MYLPERHRVSGRFRFRMMWRSHGSSAFQTPARPRRAGRAVADRLARLPAGGRARPPRARRPRPAVAPTRTPNLAYVVNTRRTATRSSRSRRRSLPAGGTVVVTYEKIGVIVVHSANPDFAQRIRTVRGVQSAGATRTSPLTAAGDDGRGRGRSTCPRPRPRRPPRRSRRRRAANRSRPTSGTCGRSAPTRPPKINPGSKKVTVAVIDTGVDDTHPDIAPNFSASQSANCAAARRTPRTAPGGR